MIEWAPTLPARRLRWQYIAPPGDQPDDKDDILLVETIVAMARSLGHKLVAEGVERKEQLDILSRLGCDYQQGYLFSRPMPASQCSSWLQKQM